MTLKTAPENSGLVKVQVSNLINVSISQNFSGESDDDCKDCPRELWFGQGSVIKSHKYINITIFYLVIVTMTVKTAPETSGLVKVQLSNSITVAISHFFQVKVTMPVKTAPENFGLAKVQRSNLKKYQYHKNFSGESDDDCKDCPREHWFGQGSVIKSQKCINITIFFRWKWRWL